MSARDNLTIGGRLALAVVLLLGALVALPRSTPEAEAQVPVPTIPNPFASPSPSPTPTEEPEPEPSSSPTAEPDEGDGDKDRKADKKKDRKRKSLLERKKRKRKNRNNVPGGGRFVGVYRPGATAFNTDELVAIAAQLLALGLGPDEITRGVYAPFIIAGPAAWINTWGAPRYGPGPIVRTHEGQDVFCELGDPVLASEEGIIEFAEGGLGGRVARLYRDDGSYWYYAHLSDWNLDELSSGDGVRAGDVIGYCGQTGNALTTPPHVHFGWYQPSGLAWNPHKTLIRWLREAEANARNYLAEVTVKKIKNIEFHTDVRLFGDAFEPDRSELSVAGESLWASGSYPTSGAFVLAETALQAALSETGFAPAVASMLDSVDLSGEGAGLEGLRDPNYVLGQIMSRKRSAGESGD